VTALRIGTRRSDLALAQAGQVRLLLQAKGIDAQLVPMTTAGDEASRSM
jgi:Porphobilinogen deaminase